MTAKLQAKPGEDVEVGGGAWHAVALRLPSAPGAPARPGTLDVPRVSRMSGRPGPSGVPRASGLQDVSRAFSLPSVPPASGLPDVSTAPDAPPATR